MTLKKFKRDKRIVAIEKLREQAIKDCWHYHGSMIKDESGGSCKSRSELEHYFGHLSLEGWEDVAFFIGYLAGLDEATEVLVDNIKDK